MATSVTNNDSRDELSSIQTQIHEKKTSMLDSTRRMLGLISESEAMGTNTAAELSRQGEQLKGIHDRCRTIDAHLVDSQRNLNKLNSIFGGIKNYFQPPKSTLPKSISQPQMSTAEKKKATAAQNAAAAAVNTRPTNTKANTDTYFGKARSDMDDIERETEDGLSDIHSGVLRLKMLATEMNRELEGQNVTLGGLSTDIEVLNQNVAKKNKMMRGM